jgi:hypothetical protein
VSSTAELTKELGKRRRKFIRPSSFRIARFKVLRKEQESFNGDNDGGIRSRGGLSRSFVVNHFISGSSWEWMPGATRGSGALT